jgi:hypothetical protein
MSLYLPIPIPIGVTVSVRGRSIREVPLRINPFGTVRCGKELALLLAIVRDLCPGLEERRRGQKR